MIGQKEEKDVESRDCAAEAHLSLVAKLHFQVANT
jgi:hypothetical protein